MGAMGISAVLTHWKIGQWQPVKMTVWFGPCPHPPTHLLIGTPPWDADLAQQSLGFALDPARLWGSLLSPSAQGAVTTALGHGEVVWAPGLWEPRERQGSPAPLWSGAEVWAAPTGWRKARCPSLVCFHGFQNTLLGFFFFLYTQPNKENHLAWVQ